MLMKRGCRVFPLALGPGGDLVRDVLARFDPRVAPGETPTELDRASAWGLLRSRAVEKGWDGVSLPLDVEEYAVAREFFAETVIFSPTVGLRDEEVVTRWSAVVALAA